MIACRRSCERKKKKKRWQRDGNAHNGTCATNNISSNKYTHAEKRTTIEGINRGRGRGKPEYRITETEAQTRTTPKLEKKKRKRNKVERYRREKKKESTNSSSKREIPILTITKTTPLQKRTPLFNSRHNPITKKTHKIYIYRPERVGKYDLMFSFDRR